MSKFVPYPHADSGQSGRESAVQTADSISELGDSITNFVIVGRLPVLNMSNISTLIQLADSSRKTIAVGRLQNGLVGMGL